MSLRNFKPTSGTTEAGLPKRNINGSNPPNAPQGDVSNQRSDAQPGPSLEGPGDVIDGPANGPDSINR